MRCIICYAPQITMAKSKGESLGIMVMEAGYGSAIPACVVAHLSKTGAALKSGLLNVGDHIISINGVSLVGMPTKLCVEQIKVKINNMPHALCTISVHVSVPVHNTYACTCMYTNDIM